MDRENTCGNIRKTIRRVTICFNADLASRSLLLAIIVKRLRDDDCLESTARAEMSGLCNILSTRRSTMTPAASRNGRSRKSILRRDEVPSLQEYVTNSVASFSLSPKRFSFSREDSKGETGRSGSTGSVTSTTNTSTAAAQQATPHGFPKVVPPPGTVTSSHTRSLSARRRTLECTPASGLTVHPATGSGATSPRRVGSFRRSGGSSDRPPLMFCRRRPSWPEVDIQATSGSFETEYI
ncbi:Uncharacterized protein DBV15_10505 [Temnothorax longispinosus]|uniref:Uncharacterized protein n=1 Tax=Temnothorax longispinosus TaxID=300112 RepID=A0A4S2KS60_9HYME|nr:Uncharacterized protein DBV15_10505 [Temnothorax longispinosus]